MRVITLLLGGDRRLPELLEAEVFQPMRMWFSGQEFCRAFAYPFRPFASHEDTVVQEEAQQIQITLLDISTQEEVVVQAAIEVFDQGTAPVGFSHCIDKSPQTAWNFHASC